ncbi:MAG: hypothetical protein Q8Q00_12545 [Dehalococcoidia bacterium]|nr:hypothetical protein [Dehalococcoidia bacterium]
MAKGPLVDRLASRGRKLVEFADAAKLNIRSALWLYRSEPDDWVLMIVVPEVSDRGPREVYKKVQRVFASHRGELNPLKLDDVVVAGPDDPLIQLLRTALQTGPGISEIRFSQNRINNTLIEDALIYRLQ